MGSRFPRSSDLSLGHFAKPGGGPAHSPCCRQPPTTPRGLVSAPIGQAIHRLLLIQAFRPDRLLAMAHLFVSTNLGESFMSIMEQPLDLTHIVDTEVRLAARALLAPGGYPLSSGTRSPPTSSCAGEAKHARPDVLCAWLRCQRTCRGPRG